MLKSAVKKIIPLIALIGLITPALSLAVGFEKCGLGDIPACVTEGFEELVIKIGSLLGSFGGFLISLAAGFIQVLIGASGSIMQSPIVLEGFKIMLSVANLGFVLAIIMIAFATILRIQNYAAKQLLWKLIVAALLVNFSFALAGVIIDLNNVFGNYFLEAASPQQIETLSSNLANTLDLQKLSSITPQASALSKFASAFVVLLAIIIFNFLLVITFFALAFMLLVRYVLLTLLLIVMPIAWLFWIFPNSSGLTKKWWTTFVRWNFFFPAVSFFLYLTIFSSAKIQEVISQGTTINNLPVQGAALIAGLNIPTILIFIQMLVQIGLILGGLMAANSMGITGASTALNIASATGKWATGAVGKLAKRPVAWTGGQVSNWALKKGGVAEKAAKALSSIGFKGTAAGIYNLTASRQAAVTNLQKEEYGKDSDNAILEKFNTVTIDKAKRAALANEVVKRNLTEKVNSNRLDSYLQDAKAMGATKEILEKRPDFAAKVLDKSDRDRLEKEVITAKPELAGNAELIKIEVDRKAITDAMRKFKPSNTENLPISSLQNVNVVVNLTEAHVSRLAKEGTEAQRMALARSAKDLPPEHPVMKAMLHSPAYQGAIESVEEQEKIEFTKWVKGSLEEKAKLEKEIKEKKAKEEEEKKKQQKQNGGTR